MDNLLQKVLARFILEYCTNQSNVFGIDDLGSVPQDHHFNRILWLNDPNGNRASKLGDIRL
jgi:hypothetical protein